MYERVIAEIARRPLDGFLITNPESVKWICNKTNDFWPAVILVAQSRLHIFTKSRNLEAIREIYPEHSFFPGGLEEVYATCKRLHLERIGIEANYVTMIDLDGLRSVLRGLEIVSVRDCIEDLRAIKTKEEIHLIQEAVLLSDRCYLEFLNHLRSGITEIEAKNIFRQIIFDRGAQDLSFDILISSGSRTFLPHAVSTNKEISHGDLVLMDFGVVLANYRSDTTRTVVMGEADEMQMELYEIVLEAQTNALGLLREGLTMSEADALARNTILAKTDYGCYDSGLGHGIGRQNHDPKPRMRPDDHHHVLKENMVVTVEPGIYRRGWGGIRIEDILVVGKESPGQILTTCPKEFTVI